MQCQAIRQQRSELPGGRGERDQRLAEQFFLKVCLGVNGYRNPPKSGGKDGLRFLVWRALLRGAEMELLNRHADVRGKKD